MTESRPHSKHSKTRRASASREARGSLRAKLREAEQTLDAIRSGLVDALVVKGPKGVQIYTLSGADYIYRVIVETMHEGTATLDSDGTILFCNQQFARLVRLPMEEVRGKTITRFAAGPQRPVLVRILEKAQSGPVKQRLALRGEDGTKTHVQVAASPLKFDRSISVCLVVSDLTELEASARSIAVLRKQQQALEQSELALRRMTDELAQSNRDLEQYAHVASHDLQEPLRQVKAFAELAHAQLAGKVDSKCAQYLQFVHDGAVRMSDLVQDLLVYAQVGGGERKLEPTSLEDALAAAVTNLESSITEAGATVTHDPLPALRADRSQMIQLFQNLLSNAIKFRRDDVPSKVHIGVRQDGRQWELGVRDNGIGIDPKYYDKVFLLFSRLNDRRSYPGTGIGLAICKKIVDRHGGRIWIESKGRGGTTVCFTIPEDAPA